MSYSIWKRKKSQTWRSIRSTWNSFYFIFTTVKKL